MFSKLSSIKFLPGIPAYSFVTGFFAYVEHNLPNCNNSVEYQKFMAV